MTETNSNLPPNGVPPVGVDLKDASVNIHDLDEHLLTGLAAIGLAHLHVFGFPLVLTSGRDSIHVAGSKHAQGQAVDVRTSDHSGDEIIVFLVLLAQMAKRFHLAIFDERMLPGAGHIHVEVAG